MDRIKIADIHLEKLKLLIKARASKIRVTTTPKMTVLIWRLFFSINDFVSV
jgi:hypothetical protein